VAAQVFEQHALPARARVRGGWWRGAA
jgi:hypothetical protein